MDARNGRVIEVTRMVCFNMSFSATPSETWLMIVSNGRWVGSIEGNEGGEGPNETEDNLRLLRKEKRLDFELRRLPFHDPLPRVADDPSGDPGVLRTMRGASITLPMVTSSNSSRSESPGPCARHIRAIRSAHSKMLTRRTAPLSSTTKGLFRRRILIVGANEGAICGGACVAIITREFDIVGEDRNESRLLSAGAM